MQIVRECNAMRDRAMSSRHNTHGADDVRQMRRGARRNKKNERGGKRIYQSEGCASPRVHVSAISGTVLTCREMRDSVGSRPFSSFF